MPPKSTPTAKKPREIKIRDLDYQIDFKPRGIKSSDDVCACTGIIGQRRAYKAMKTGLHIDSSGYNIFLAGMAGTGRTAAVKYVLSKTKSRRPNLSDVCYVNNFRNEDCPRILTFAAGDGVRFKKDMAYLINSIRKAVPKIFMSEDYKDRQSRIVREFEGRQKKLIHGFEEKLSTAGFVMVQLQSGMGVRNEIQPLIDEEPESLESLERLAKDGKFSLSRLDELRRTWDSLRREFDTTTVESKKLTSKMEDALEKLNFSMVAPLITDKINLIKKRFPDEKVISYLEEVEEALVSDLDRFREAQPRRGEEEPPPYRKREPFEDFSVNLILNNSSTSTVPVIIEKSPSYKNLFGSLERVVDRFGYWRTDFTRIFAGSLLKAAGGFLILNAMDVLTEPGVWVHLKRTLRNGEIEITGFDPLYMMAGSGIKPEPIPINVKVVLIGEPRTYRLLWQLDDDFKKIFKIKAEFDTSIKCNKNHLQSYFEFVRRVVEEEQLPPFDLSGMQAVAEYGMRLAGRRGKLSTRFTLVSDIIRESAFCAQQRRVAKVQRKDVYCAIEQKRSRVNLVEDKIQEMFDDETLMVSTSGKEVGQINGLSVYSLGEYSFGRPTRITASTSMGRAGVINIERESDLSGPTHNKGVLILSGYLRYMFAQDKPLQMTASISFEQSYSGVDGDSASSTEMYAILSSLSGIPLKQSIAVTGSVNQQGEIQPIGGINEKIEGFFDVCQSRRLSGHQGVMMPYQNVPDLLLRPDVIEAVRDGKFHIYPIKTIGEGVEILTGQLAGRRLKSGKFSPGSVFAIVDEKLREMALALQNFGREDNEDNGKKKKTN
ncbi:MAG: ATP-dependent protease [Candidatus Zixiibacteriota bacterium]|nr:MAG: ATP-dependent protease [candidate division Zixibacteria bacterium]